jgi:hypothetical protein
VDEFPNIQVQFDSSLKGFGFFMTNLQSNDVLLVFSLTSQYQFSDFDNESRFMNTMEFISVIIIFCHLIAMGYSEKSIQLVGDSMTALSMSVKEAFKDPMSKRAAIVYMALVAMSNISIAGTTHVSSEDNIICDQLSRGTCPSELGYHIDQVGEINDFPILSKILEFVNPTITIGDSIEELISVVNQVQGLMTELTCFRLNRQIS